MKRTFLTLLFMLGLFAVQADEPMAEIAFDKRVTTSVHSLRKTVW